MAFDMLFWCFLSGYKSPETATLGKLIKFLLASEKLCYFCLSRLHFALAFSKLVCWGQAAAAEGKCQYWKEGRSSLLNLGALVRRHSAPVPYSPFHSRGGQGCIGKIIRSVVGGSQTFFGLPADCIPTLFLKVLSTERLG